MSPRVDIQCASVEPVPHRRELGRWVSAALAAVPAAHRRRGAVTVSVRLVDREEMSRLNDAYRGKPGPTNVLAFAADLPAGIDEPLLGDIVICAPVVRAEAAAQGKTETAHWAHMAVHGTLHLLGMDHAGNAEAAAMEALESAILRDLDFPCPYGDLDTVEPVAS